MSQTRRASPCSPAEVRGASSSGCDRTRDTTQILSKPSRSFSACSKFIPGWSTILPRTDSPARPGCRGVSLFRVYRVLMTPIGRRISSRDHRTCGDEEICSHSYSTEFNFQNLRAVSSKDVWELADNAPGPAPFSVRFLILLKGSIACCICVARGVSGEATAGYILGGSFSMGMATNTFALVRVYGTGLLYKEALEDLWKNYEATYGSAEGEACADQCPL